MFQLHGWITISKLSIAEKKDILRKVKDKIQELNLERKVINLKMYNDTSCLSITLSQNRYTPIIQELFELVGTIGKIAKYSYGILQIYDFLSPVDPTLYFIE